MEVIENKNNNIIRCEICGTENNSNNYVCEGCGAKLRSDSAKQDSENAAHKKGKGNKAKGPVGKGKAYKEIKSVNVAYLLIGLFLLGAVILFSAGVFNEPDAVAELGNAGTEDFHNGASMAQLQQINALKENLSNNPEDHQTMLQLAHLLNDSGFFQEAVTWYNKYLGSHPEAADVYVDRGVCYYQMNDLDRAMKSMEKGIEIDPRHQIAHFNLGIVNLAANNKDEAIKWWNKAIELDPSSNIAVKSRELIKNNTNN